MRERKVLLGVILALVVMVLMAKNTSRNNNPNVSINTYKIDSTEIIAQQQEQKRIEDSIIRVESFKDSIKLIKYYTSNPNSVGGVDCNIVWKNNTKRTIKYMRFGVVAVNGVDDPVTCRIRDRYITYVRVTGPIKSKTTDGWNTYWENIWYNHSIKKMKIHSYEIEFMDGEKVEVML